MRDANNLCLAGDSPGGDRDKELDDLVGDETKEDLEDRHIVGPNCDWRGDDLRPQDCENLPRPAELLHKKFTAIQRDFKRSFQNFSASGNHDRETLAAIFHKKQDPTLPFLCDEFRPK